MRVEKSGYKTAAQFCGNAVTHSIASGLPVKTLDACASKTIYVTRRTYSPSLSCTAVSASGGPAPDLSAYSASVTLNNWRALFTISAQGGGDYVISCSGPVSNARYGIGDHIGATDVAYPFMGIAASPPRL